MNLSSVDAYIAKQLHTRRLALNLSQRKLAELCGVSLRQIQKYEIGLNKIGASKLYLFSKILNVEITYFFDGFTSEENNHLNDESNRLAHLNIVKEMPVVIAEV